MQEDYNDYDEERAGYPYSDMDEDAEENIGRYN